VDGGLRVGSFDRVGDGANLEETVPMIRVVCGCGRVFKAEARHSGKRTRCPVCGTGLIIGQTPASSSSEGDLDEVPSWWYPSDPQDPFGSEGEPPGGAADPDSVRTAVLPPAPEPKLEVEQGDEAGREALGLGGGLRTASRPVAAGRRLWTLAMAASAVLAMGVLSWMRAAPPGRGEGIPAQGPSVRRDGGRGAAVPEVGEVRDRGAASAAPGGRPAPAARRLRLLVPAYIYPAGEGRKQWQRLGDAAAKVDLVVIVNPDTGPGIERNSVYASAIAEAADRGVKLVGYVSTQYADRPAAKVKADIDAWVRFYPRIIGFFLDQQPRDPGHAAYFAEISTYARGKLRDALVITNPGIPCDEAYLARRASDLVCVFANFEGFGPFEMPAYLKGYDPSHYAALVYQVADAESMSTMLKEAIIKRIGYIYVTDGKQPSQWGRLPAYWDAEVEAVTRLH
jgi:Spherulation-specific family 4